MLITVSSKFPCVAVLVLEPVVDVDVLENEAPHFEDYGRLQKR